METVKMFDANEIQKEIGIDILDIYWGNICNDVAISWWVEDEDDYEKINSYLLAHGAVLGERVWIDVNW